MGKKNPAMIDSLFGSKTRVKLLHLFFNNSGKAFYVREITRLIDEQINSVRRELSNMLEVGVIVSSTADNKLYYEVNQQYAYYTAFRMIFSDGAEDRKQVKSRDSIDPADKKLQTIFKDIKGLRAVVAAGVLVSHSASPLDLLVAGQKSKKLDDAIKKLELVEGRELVYAVLSYDDFYYRLSVRDKFITEVLTNRHEVVLDSDKILKTWQ